MVTFLFIIVIVFVILYFIGSASNKKKQKDAIKTEININSIPKAEFPTVTTILPKSTMPQPEKQPKKGCIIAVIIFVVVIIGTMIIGKCASNNPTLSEPTVTEKTVDEPKLTPEQEKAKEDARIAKEVVDQLDDIKMRLDGIEETEKDPSEFRADIASIKNELNLFYALYSAIDGAEKSTNKEVKAAGAKLKKRTIAFQKSEFPKMRQAYFDVIYNPFWKENITTKLKGPNKTHIQFLGVVFASNKNISDFQTNLNSILHDLRFKKAGYSWSEYDGYSTYTLKTPPDNEFVTIQPD